MPYLKSSPFSKLTQISFLKKNKTKQEVKLLPFTFTGVSWAKIGSISLACYMAGETRAPLENLQKHRKKKKKLHT